MAYLDTAHFDKAQPGIAWEAVAAQLDLGRRKLPSASPEMIDSLHVKRVQQMLLAAAVSGGAIIAIAAVMLLRLL